jgi:hypothetical protein
MTVLQTTKIPEPVARKSVTTNPITPRTGISEGRKFVGLDHYLVGLENQN